MDLLEINYLLYVTIKIVIKDMATTINTKLKDSYNIKEKEKLQRKKQLFGKWKTERKQGI